MTRSERRIRPRLLFLLWLWAACVFLLVDLFWNVDEFDAVRPRARLYRGMRQAAHRMVGEPIRGDRTVAEWARPSQRASSLGEALAAVNESVERRSFADLREYALHGADPRVRIAALRGLARLFDSRARATLLAVCRSDVETDKVKKQAALFVGWTGAGAFPALESLLEPEGSAAVREGAILGMGELGTEEAVGRLLLFAADPPSRQRQWAVVALARVDAPAAAGKLAVVAADTTWPVDVRMSACRALGACGGRAAAKSLTQVLATPGSPDLRARAAQALGRIGVRDALPTVSRACSDASPAVAREARLARMRLEHVTVRKEGR